MQSKLFVFYHQWQKVIPYGIMIIMLLVLMLVWFGLWQRLQDIVYPSSLTTPILQKPLASLEENITTIKAANFFGSSIATSENLPPSLLNLQVKAIFLHEPANLSSAIILLNGGKEKIYRMGDNIGGEAIITQITADSVVISRGGRLERLMMPHPSLQFRPNTPLPQNPEEEAETKND